MDKLSNTKYGLSSIKTSGKPHRSFNESGFTLVEVLVSVGIMLIFLPFAASMLTNSQLLASYSKHKIQAAYLAQQIMETERQLPFAQIVNQAATRWPLDTKGNYNNASNYFYGIVVIKVTPAAYTSNSGVKTTSILVDHVVVTVSWIEQIINLQVPLTETYAEDIANDTMLN